jgi:oligopeptide/dipeptide ABC transporter ATP-binding protein
VSAAPLLEVSDLKVHFALRGGRGVLKAVDGVSLTVGRGEIVGVVGESGSGKTTLGRAVLRLVEPTGGRVRFEGQDLTGLSARAMRPFRRRMQMVFQDPSGNLNPAMTVGEVIGEGLALHRLCKPGDRAARVAVLLDRVGLPRAAAARYSKELSGGQRQRVGIARALSVEPSLIVADEAVSALDVSVQAQIVNLLQDLQAELGLAILFIGHDLGLVHHLCARVTVLYLGKVMETAPAEVLQAHPRHPYTRALLEAEPRPDPGARRPAAALTGEPPSPISPPSGCVFRTRCRHALATCAEIVPELEPSEPNHLAACIRQFEIDP